MNEPSQPWGKRLLAALTSEQIERLLDVVARTGALEKLDELLRAIDPDLAQTLRALIAPVETTTAASAQPTVSDQKAMETWEELWGTWESHVAEVGDEKGDYVIQERDWDPPYFDPTALADDLDKVAQQMLEWLERAFPLAKEPDLFAQALKRIDENIGAYPEWMQGGDEFCSLGPHSTTCVLRWTWEACEGRAAKGREFLQRMHALEQECQRVGLDTEQCFKFFVALPEACRQEVHACLSGPDFAEARDDTRSVWHRIHHHVEQQFDPSAYLRSSEMHLPGDWHYGEALIADSVARKDYAQAEAWMERTLASFLRLTEDAWRPEDSLLLPVGHYYYEPARSEDALKLLEQWETVARSGNDRARAASCQLQRAILSSSLDWQAILRAFDEFQHEGGAGKVAERLFVEWRKWTAEQCADDPVQKQRPEDSWAGLLIEARRAPGARKKALLDHLDVWFECLQTHASFFEKQWRSLALLTRVLPGGERCKARFPIFHAHVLVPSLGVQAKLEQSLREALGFLGAEIERVDPMPIWEKHLHTLVPAPGGSGSNYRESALWMQALSEVNRGMYDKLLADWRVTYRRRRNLWADMKALSLPGV